MNCVVGGLLKVLFLSSSVGISSDCICCCRRFERSNGKASTIWSSYIVGVLGVMSKLLPRHASRPVDPTGDEHF